MLFPLAYSYTIQRMSREGKNRRIRQAEKLRIFPLKNTLKNKKIKIFNKRIEKILVKMIKKSANSHGNRKKSLKIQHVV